MQRSVKFNRIATSVDYGRWPNARGGGEETQGVALGYVEAGLRPTGNTPSYQRAAMFNQIRTLVDYGRWPNALGVVKSPRALPWATLKQAFGHKDIGWRRLTTWYATRIRHDYAIGVKCHSPGSARTSPASACATLGCKRKCVRDEQNASRPNRHRRVAINRRGECAVVPIRTVG